MIQIGHREMMRQTYVMGILPIKKIGYNTAILFYVKIPITRHDVNNNWCFNQNIC